MKFIDYIDSLDASQLQQYAKRCGTSVLYIKNHLRGGTRTPRPSLLSALWQKSDGQVSRDDVLEHFLPSAPAKKRRAA